MSCLTEVIILLCTKTYSPSSLHPSEVPIKQVPEVTTVVPGPRGEENERGNEVTTEERTRLSGHRWRNGLLSSVFLEVSLIFFLEENQKKKKDPYSLRKKSSRGRLKSQLQNN